MADLSTTYMGLPLRNPLIVSSSSLSKTLDGIKQCAAAGAGAIVLKSLFEEQILFETEDVARHSQPAWHTEAMEYIQNMGMELGPRDYLTLIEEAKKAVDIPIIASLNCFSTRWWADYAKKLEVAGADAIELNIAMIVSDPRGTGEQLEEHYLKVLEEVHGRVNIPLALKIGPQFTSLANFAERLCRHGADALVFFNRFYRLDIDIEHQMLTAGNPFSTPDEQHLPLRWIALLSGRIDCDFSATTGIHQAEDAIKMLLAGANTVQVCSTLYKHGLEHIGTMLRGIEEWMTSFEYQTIGDFRGKLCQLNSSHADMYQRLQYIKLFVGID